MAGLALLALPRAILHDLDVVAEGTLVNGLLVFVPIAIWVIVVVAKRPARPVATLAMVGAIYGVLLAIAHQALWHVAWGEHPPQLGGNLADLPPLAHEVITRGFGALSSLATGVVVGLIAGTAAWGISRFLWVHRRAEE